MKLRREPIDTSERDEYSKIDSEVISEKSNENEAFKVSDLEGKNGQNCPSLKAEFSAIRTDINTIFITIDFIWAKESI